MSDKVEKEPDHILPVDGRTRDLIFEGVGIGVALGALGGERPNASIVGFVMAHAMVQAKMADHRARVSQAIFRCVAKHGVDIARSEKIIVNADKGVVTLEVHLADLVDMAEDRQ